jgi:hypothetical protein
LSTYPAAQISGATSIDTQDGTRLVYVLSQIGKLIEMQRIAERVEALELALGRRPKP